MLRKCNFSQIFVFHLTSIRLSTSILILFANTVCFNLQTIKHSADDMWPEWVLAHCSGEPTCKESATAADPTSSNESNVLLKRSASHMLAEYDRAFEWNYKSFSEISSIWWVCESVSETTHFHYKQTIKWRQTRAATARTDDWHNDQLISSAETKTNAPAFDSRPPHTHIHTSYIHNCVYFKSTLRIHTHTHTRIRTCLWVIIYVGRGASSYVWWRSVKAAVLSA